MRMLVLLSGLVLAVGLALGCGGAAADGPGPASAPSDQAAADQTPADQESTAGLRAHHRHHHHGGVAMFVALSLDTLGADDAKRPQIEKLQADLRGRMGPARAAEKNLLAVLADGIAAGTLDQAKVDAAMAQVASAAEAVHAATVEALNQLHALLSPEERAELVEKVKAHAEVWRKVNHDAEPGGREGGGRLAELTKDVGLTPEQADKIAVALKSSSDGVRRHFNREAAAKRLDAFAAGFVGDTFDAGTLRASAGADGHLAAHGSKRMVHFHQTVLPLLTPEQRTKLAGHLREHQSSPEATPGQ
jgi:Spy/CpxP family protein refolding chaperone